MPAQFMTLRIRTPLCAVPTPSLAFPFLCGVPCCYSPGYRRIGVEEGEAFWIFLKPFGSFLCIGCPASSLSSHDWCL